MPQRKVLVLELGPVDRRGPRPVALDEVPSLRHEPSDDAVELRALVPLREAVAGAELARAELAEVLGGAGGDVGEELHRDPSGGEVPDRDVFFSFFGWKWCGLKEERGGGGRGRVSVGSKESGFSDGDDG